MERDERVKRLAEKIASRLSMGEDSRELLTQVGKLLEMYEKGEKLEDVVPKIMHHVLHE